MSDFQRGFDDVSLTYDRVRPDYPSELFSEIFAYKPLYGSSRALEIGLGSGKATAPILATGCAVVGVEPGENLAAIAREWLKNYNNFSLKTCTFQDFECESETFDLIYAATAFHWISPEYGYPRVLELLKSGGAFARFRYHAGPDASRPALADEIRELYNKYMPRAGEYKEFSAKDAENVAKIAENYGFVDAKFEIFQFTKDFSTDEYLELLRTYPDHMRLADEPRGRLFGGIRDAIERHGGTITVHYVADLELARKP